MEITFITGNAGKFSEAQTVLSEFNLTQRTLDLPELQSLDVHEVMRAKLEAAASHGIAPCMVEDSSLTFACLGNRLPGPFIKWFEASLGIEGLFTLTQKYGDSRATSSTLVGYLDEEGAMHYFDGSVNGQIVSSRGEHDFGYGPVFLPDGSRETFGEMSRAEKNRIGSRAQAFMKLRDFLSAEK